MILATTGYRPAQIKAGGRNAQDPQVFRALIDFALTCLEEQDPTLVTTDLHEGWGLACGQAALECGLPYVVFIADKNYRKHSSDAVRRNYFRVLSGALGCVEDGTEGMIGHADRVLGLWAEPTPQMQVAQRLAKPVVNVWDRWLRYAATPQARATEWTT